MAISMTRKITQGSTSAYGHRHQDPHTYPIMQELRDIKDHTEPTDM
jgi:hypothetical protein